MKDFVNYHRNGQIAWKGTVLNSHLFRLKKWEEYYENGQLSREYFYNDSIPNQREGTWSWWDEQGNLIKQEIYKNGELIDTKTYLPRKKIKD